MAIGETKIKILTAALMPSRYTDLAKSSGVSKTMFDRHLNDLIEDGLIEKTEEGLYVITAKGVELLMKMKASEQQSMLEKLKDLVLHSKKTVPKEVKHCWFEIGRLYAEYLLDIRTLTHVQTSFFKLAREEDLVSFVISWENLIDTSFSLGIYIIGRLREYIGRFTNPIASLLERIITTETRTSFEFHPTPEGVKSMLEGAESRLNLILDEVKNLSIIGKDDKEIRQITMYLEIKLEDLKTNITKLKEYISRRTGEA